MSTFLSVVGLVVVLFVLIPALLTGAAPQNGADPTAHPDPWNDDDA